MATSDDLESRRARYRAGVLQNVFGGRLGLALFLGTLVFFGLVWRFDVFMTDSRALVHGLGALADGNLFIEQPYIGSSVVAPGIWEGVGGPVARNYGQIVISLPVLVVLRATEFVLGLHVTLLAAWHILLFGFGVLVGRIRGRERLSIIGGGVLVLLSFGLNLLFVSPLPSHAPYVISLQITTLLAAALSAVVCYRLVAAIHSNRLGLFAGAALAVATPVGFWASFPKRHIFTGLAVLLLLFTIHHSRAVDTDASGLLLPRTTEFRCLAYAVVGLYAWVHAAEALFMFVALAVVDLPTAPHRDIRTLGAIGVAFGLSLLPMFTTNFLLTGDPLTPPRLLPNYTGSGGSGAPSSPGGGLGGGGGGGVSTGFMDVFDRASRMAVGGFVTLTTDVDRFIRTYVRSHPGEIQYLGGQYRLAGANLSVIESMPLAAGLVGGLALVFLRLRRGATNVLSGIRTTDALAVFLGLTFASIYADRLPLHAQNTQRYLFPLYPLAVYGLARLPPTRRVFAERWRLAVGTYGLALSIGGVLLPAFVTRQDLGVGEAFQVHAIVNLELGLLLAIALAASSLRPIFDRLSAVAFGLSAAAGTILILLSAVLYFPIGPYLLPIVEALSEIAAIG